MAKTHPRGYLFVVIVITVRFSYICSLHFSFFTAVLSPVREGHNGMVLKRMYGKGGG